MNGIAIINCALKRPTKIKNHVLIVEVIASTIKKYYLMVFIYAEDVHGGLSNKNNGKRISTNNDTIKKN